MQVIAKESICGKMDMVFWLMRSRMTNGKHLMVVEGATRALRLKEIRTSIANQWHTQKHITPENNHEVNLYRGTVRVTQQYPKHIVAMGVCMLALLVFGM